MDRHEGESLVTILPPRVEGEKPPSLVQYVILGPSVVEALQDMHERYTKGFHDLLIFAGPSDQKGPVRFLNEAVRMENPRVDSTYRGVADAIFRYVTQLKSTKKEVEVLGLATTVGSVADVGRILRPMKQGSLYFAGGGQLFAGNLMHIGGPGKIKAYMLDVQGEIVQFLDSAVQCTLPLSAIEL